MSLSLIVAHDKQLGIGKDNDLLWDFREDMKHFVNATKGQWVVMGRKTYESIGGALPNRENIVLTRNSNWIPYRAVKHLHTISDIDTVLNLAKTRDIYIIGGAEIYKLFLPYANKLIVTEIDGDFEADTFFPHYKHLGFKETEARALFDTDRTTNHVYALTIKIYEKF